MRTDLCVCLIHLRAFCRRMVDFICSASNLPRFPSSKIVIQRGQVGSIPDQATERFCDKEEQVGEAKKLGRGAKNPGAN